MNKFISKSIDPNRIQNKVIIDKIVKGFFLGVTLLCASVIIIVVLFIFVRGISPFIKNYNIDGVSYKVNPITFLFGSTWFQPPSIYGVGYIIINTLYIVLLALIFAAPISVLTALFIGKIAPKRTASILSYVIDILASIPSILYGLFGVGLINKLVSWLSNLVGYQSAGGISTLSTVLVLAIMIIPTITMLSLTSIRAVKNNVINGSLALGASPTQTNFKVILTSAKSGIFSGIILGVGRALGEATAVSMVAGNRGSGPTFNLFDTTRTLTSTMLMGLKETTGLDYDIRFSVGIVLIFVILITNLLLNGLKRKLGNIK
jgi:phosphate transport system permease protein